MSALPYMHLHRHIEDERGPCTNCDSMLHDSISEKPVLFPSANNSLPLHTMTEAKIRNFSPDPDPLPLDKVYRLHFDELYRYAFSMLKNQVQAEDVVQSVFLDVWQNKYHDSIHTSIRAFLFKSVYFKCLNEIKHEKVKGRYLKQNTFQLEVLPEDEGDQHDLRHSLEDAINRLPPECRKVFELCKIKGLKYHEAAAELNISAKTVENQMGKALKNLRQTLLKYLLIFFLLSSILP